jgi:protein-S-isoprenylcysteine O-methyltransferase Ste14
VPKHVSGLGSEHRLCDLVQLVVISLFFAVWIADFALQFLLGASSVIIDFRVFPLLLIPAILTSAFGLYLGSKSHDLVFGKQAVKNEVIDCGVYSRVRHPMYLGALLFCLGFFFASLSIVSFLVWVSFFCMYDKMTKYEENELVRILGKKYVDYTKRVPKWFPRIKK